MNINVYCDESCHLQHDHSPIMTLGAVQFPKDDVRRLALQIKALKTEYQCLGELKWTKVSEKNILFYLALLDLFQSEESLHFRALVVNNKSKLDHETYNDGEHDSFYYKMYYELVRNIIENKSNHCFNVYLDIKDTKSSLKVQTLKQVLANKFRDFDFQQICKIQQIRSHESALLQLCDFLLGAVTYSNRSLGTSAAKLQVVAALQAKVGYNLRKTTPPWEEKFNLFHFEPRDSFNA